MPMRRSNLVLKLACASMASSVCGLGVPACGHERLVAVTSDFNGTGSGGTTGTGGQGNVVTGSGGSTNPSLGGSPGTCRMFGDKCQAPSDCCSQVCDPVGSDMVCQLAPSCRSGMATCTSGGDCCSNVCGTDGTCPTLPWCRIVGETCSANGNCCSGACGVNGTGNVSTCQSVDGCKPAGEICSVGQDCCSGSCSLTSFNVNRCDLPASGCSPPGELCDPFGNKFPPCCGDRMGGAGGTPSRSLCSLTAAGVPRCWNPAPSGPTPEGGSCKVHEDCASGYCLPTGNGLICGAKCVSNNDRCSAARDCCDNAQCIKGICRPQGIVCKQLGQACLLPDECCTSNCAPSASGRYYCAVPLNP